MISNDIILIFSDISYGIIFDICCLHQLNLKCVVLFSIVCRSNSAPCATVAITVLNTYNNIALTISYSFGYNSSNNVVLWIVLPRNGPGFPAPSGAHPRATSRERLRRLPDCNSVVYQGQKWRGWAVPLLRGLAAPRDLAVRACI